MSIIYTVQIDTKSANGTYFFKLLEFEFDTVAEAQAFAQTFVAHVTGDDVYRVSIRVKSGYMYSENYKEETK